VLLAFRGVLLYSLMDIYQHFGGKFYLHLQDKRILHLKIKAAVSSETLVNFYLAACPHIPGRQ
jgi:hypothetical protein